MYALSNLTKNRIHDKDETDMRAVIGALCEMMSQQTSPHHIYDPPGLEIPQTQAVLAVDGFSQ